MSTKNNVIDKTKKRNDGPGDDPGPPPTIRVLFKTSADAETAGEDAYGTEDVTNVNGDIITFDKALVTVSHNRADVQVGTTIKITLVGFNETTDKTASSTPWSGASEHGKVQTGGGTVATSTFYPYLIPPWKKLYF